MASPASLRRDVSRALADHDHQLALVVDVGRLPRDDDRLAGILQRGDGFVKDLGVRRLRAAAEVTLVVEPDRHDLAGLAGREQLDLGELVGDAGGGAVAEEVAANLADGVAFQDAVGRGRSRNDSECTGSQSDIVAPR